MRVRDALKMLSPRSGGGMDSDTPPKFNSEFCPWKNSGWKIGRRSFPIGFWQLFRGKLAVKLREGIFFFWGGGGSQVRGTKSQKRWPLWFAAWNFPFPSKVACEFDRICIRYNFFQFDLFEQKWSNLVVWQYIQVTWLGRKSNKPCWLQPTFWKMLVPRFLKICSKGRSCGFFQDALWEDGRDQTNSMKLDRTCHGELSELSDDYGRVNKIEVFSKP